VVIEQWFGEIGKVLVVDMCKLPKTSNLFWNGIGEN